MACVDVPALPLQLLLKENPKWRNGPVAVVDRDKPQGRILWTNPAAERYRILPGMRFAVGLSLSRDLRAGVVTDLETETALTSLTKRLQSFSPVVEPSDKQPGVFWLSGKGLGRLFPSWDDWTLGIQEAFTGESLDAKVAVGFSRFGSFAAARTSDTRLVFDTAVQERRYVYRAPITRLGFPPDLRDVFLKLGIQDLGAFLALPAEGIRKRFGAEAFDLYRMAKSGGRVLVPEPLTEPLKRMQLFDYPESSLDRLLVAIEPLLHSLLNVLRARDALLSTLQLKMDLADGTNRRDQVRPASPTSDMAQLMRLVRLRLESMRFSSGVEEIDIHVVGVNASREQLTLFHTRPKRDVAAANRSLARLRARFGDGAVVRAVVREGHLPEACFGWEALLRIDTPQARAGVEHRLIRRVFDRSRALPGRLKNEPDGWLIRGTGLGPVEESIGPYVVSGGWWLRRVQRAYHYVRTSRSGWMWIYHDGERRTWFQHGEVE